MQRYQSSEYPRLQFYKFGVYNIYIIYIINVNKFVFVELKKEESLTFLMFTHSKLFNILTLKRHWTTGNDLMTLALKPSVL